MICDEMVNIVAPLPPPHGQAAAEIGNEDGDQAVDGEVAGDGAMTGIVRAEHDLLPEEAEEEGRSHVPPMVQGEHGGGKERRVADHLLAVLDIRAVVEALIVDPLVQSPVLFDNLLLHIDVDRRVCLEIPLYILRLGPAGEGSGLQLGNVGLVLRVRLVVDRRGGSRG